VPLSNYGGWLLTTWLFYQAFAVYLGRRPGLPVPSAAQGRTLRLVAIAFYLSSGLTHLTPWLSGQSGEVVDAAGHLWRISDLRATTAVTVLFTMFFTSLLAALRWLLIAPTAEAITPGARSHAHTRSFPRYGPR
jgi:putative membrane protein